MTALLELAGCEKKEDLDEAEQRSGEYVQMKEKLSDVESTLAQIAEGIALSALEEQIKEIDPKAGLWPQPNRYRCFGSWV